MSSTMRIPEHMITTINELVRTSRRMLAEIGREPTAEEIADRLAMPLEKAHKCMEIAGLPLDLKRAVGTE